MEQAKNIQQADMLENAIIKNPKEQIAAYKAIDQQMIGISVSKLDELQKLAGELVMTEAMVTQNSDIENLELDNFMKAARQLHKIINDVQDTVMSMRMIPLKPTFSKMHRVVRDMCRQLNKEVELEIIGADTEVDTNVADHIYEPIAQIIRNAIDTGIEPADKRSRSGKSANGLIKLEAKKTGDEIIITISDDGGGLDRNLILDRATQLGLTTRPLHDYSDKDAFQFILMPGFSTNNNTVGGTSDRQEIDVLATNIEAVGGSIFVESELGTGTVYMLKIPMTLAIIDGMIIRLGKAKFTLPISQIRDSFEPDESDMFTDPDGNEMTMVRGVAYNVVRLNEFYNMDIDAQSMSDGIMILIENEEDMLCVFTDELIGEQQVVVKTIPKYLKRVPGLSGCTILGNGDISLIIDVAGLFA